MESRAVNIDSLEDELARIRPRLEQVNDLEEQLSEARRHHDELADQLTLTRQAKAKAEEYALQVSYMYVCSPRPKSMLSRSLACSMLSRSHSPREARTR